MRLGIFGGSFNPPHGAHLLVAEAAARAVHLDRVLWIPAKTSPFKVGDKEMAPAEVRLEMVQALIQGNERFDVSNRELHREDPSYTVDTLRGLREEYPADDLFLILGGDSLAGFSSWREPREILKLAELVVYRRPDGDEQTTDEVTAPDWVMEHVMFVEDAVPLNVSASRIRTMIRAGSLPEGLIPDSVLSIIEREGLYGYSQ